MIKFQFSKMCAKGGVCFGERGEGGGEGGELPNRQVTNVGELRRLLNHHQGRTMDIFKNDGVECYF